MIAVSNSTPLIALSRIGKFNLLKDYFGTIYIPNEVYTEVVVRGENLFGAKEVASEEWVRVERVENQLAVDALCTHLDKGEAEAIVLAKEKNAEILIIDDGDGRKSYNAWLWNFWS